jgi:hypothetical protein
LSLISIYIETEFALSDFDDFETEATRVIDELFDLEAASDLVHDAGASGNSKIQNVCLTLFADGQTVESASANALKVIFEAISKASTSTWTWKSTKTEDPASDAELEALSPQVSV